MWGLPGDSVVKNLLANVEDIRDAGSISGSGRSARAEILMGREEGGGFRMGNTCIPVVDSF